MIALANAIARDAPGNGCAAHREIASLSAQAHALVNANRVPAALRTQLLSGVEAVVSTAPACIATPPSTTEDPKHEKVKHDHAEHDKQKHDKQKHDHGHNSGEQD
jgi:hypothetical protein